MSNALVLPPRSYGWANWVGLATLTRREIARFIKVAGQTIVAPLVNTALFMAAFALALQGRDGPAPGVSYAAFIAPGLLMTAIVNNAFANTSSSLIIAKVQGNATDFLLPPFSAWELTVAFLAGGCVRGIVVGAAGALILAPVADMGPDHWWAILYYSVAASLMFSALGLAGGLWAEKFDSLAAVTNFIIAPLTMLSGTFFSIEVLPEPYRSVAHWNPVFFLIDGFRYGFIGHADGHLARGALVTLALTAALCWLCWRLLKVGYRLKA